MIVNWKRGLFRLWLVTTGIWLVVGSYVLAGDFTATTLVSQVPKGENPYSCVITRTPCTVYPLAAEPNWAFRRRAAILLAAPPIIIPILLFLAYSAGRVAWRVGTWVARGFREAS